MDINLDKFNPALTTFDSIATSASAFNGGPSSVSSNVPSFVDHLQQATQQSSSGYETDSSKRAASATIDGNDVKSNSTGANTDDCDDSRSNASTNRTDRSRRNDRASHAAKGTERKGGRSKSKHDDEQEATAQSSQDRDSSPKVDSSSNPSTADRTTADANEIASQAAAADVAQSVVTTPSSADLKVQGQIAATQGKPQTPAIPSGPVAVSNNKTIGAAQGAADQQSNEADAQVAVQTTPATTDAAATTLQAATQPALATEVVGKNALQTGVPAEGSNGQAANANLRSAAIAVASGLPTPAVTPTTNATLPKASTLTDPPKSDSPSTDGQDATVAFAVPTAGVPAAIAAAVLGNTTVDTASVGTAAPAVAEISKTSGVESKKSDGTSQASQNSTSSTSTNGSMVDSSRPAFTLGPQSNFAGEHGTTISAGDQARFVQRVAKAFEAARTHDGPLVLRLSPPELGSLRLEISLRDGALTAHVQTDNSSTRNILLDNLPALRDRLEQQDIHIERFNVEVQDRSPGGQPQLPDQNPGANDTGRRYRAPNSIESVASAEPAIQGAAPGLSDGGQLNVVI